MSLIYNDAKATMNAANWVAYDVRTMLVGPSYTPDPDHVFVNQVVGELTAPSYARKSIAGRYANVDTVNDLVAYGANNPTWISLAGGEQVRRLVFFKQVTNDSDSRLLFCLDLQAFSTAGDNFVIRFNNGVTAGIVFELKSTADPLQGPQGPQGIPGNDGGVTLPLNVADIDAVGIANGSVIVAIGGIATWGSVPVAFDITGFGLTGSTLVQLGQSVTNPGLSASYNQSATSASLTDTEGHNDVLSLPATSIVSSHVFTKTTLGASVGFTLHAAGALGADTAGASLTWGERVYYGTSTIPGAYNEAFIESLSAALRVNPAGSYAFNASAGQYSYICVLTALGLTISNFFVDGFPWACSRIATGVAVVNAFGVSVTYDVFKSDNIVPGSFNVVVVS